MSRNASAVPGSRECASASASVGSNPAEPAAERSTRPAPPKGTILDSSAPKSSSPMTVRSIVPSSLFETNRRSSSRRTPRPCRRSTSANTRPWKSAPGPKLMAITCNGPGICRPPRRTQEPPRGSEPATDYNCHAPPSRPEAARSVPRCWPGKPRSESPSPGPTVPRLLCSPRSPHVALTGLRALPPRRRSLTAAGASLDSQLSGSQPLDGRSVPAATGRGRWSSLTVWSVSGSFGRERPWVCSAAVHSCCSEGTPPRRR